ASALVTLTESKGLLLSFVLIVAVMTTGTYAQQGVPPSAAPAARIYSSAGADTESSEVSLLVGRSTVVNVGTQITRVSLTSPEIADALVTTPSQVLIHGKTPGTISM